MERFIPSKFNDNYIVHTDNSEDIIEIDKNFDNGKYSINQLFFDFGETVEKALYSNQNYVEIIKPIPINNDDLLLIAVGRNERAIMPAFFNHYRNIDASIRY